MKKSDLIDVMAEKADISKATAAQAFEALIDTIVTTLANDDQVVLLNFGTFAVKERAARVGRNPQTGEKINIKSSRIASFKAGKRLKEAVN